MTALNVPEPIAAYFDADKQGGGAVARCFTKDGTVKDEGQTYVGRAAIEKWKNAASTTYSYTSKPLAVEHQDGRYIVTSEVTGTFPGSPIDLRYAFRLERGRIGSLEITS